MEPHDLLLDIHALEEDLLSFERKYGVRSDIFYAAYMHGEEPEDDAWMLDFGEWGSVYKTWLSRLAEYRNVVHPHTRITSMCRRISSRTVPLPLP